MNLVFINSHPTQYFSPLYREIAGDGSIKLKVIYLSYETVEGYNDQQFGVNVKWDIPLLEGYHHTFIKNRSWKPSIKNGFLGLINLGLFRELRILPKRSIVVVHGWAYLSNVLAIQLAFLFGHKVCLRGETPYKQESQKSFFKKIPRWLFLKTLIFPFVQKFLYIGEQNRLFYKHLGVPDSALVFTPYCVDNKRFQVAHENKLSLRKTMREKLQVNEKDILILFSGKYIEKKRPMDLLKAFQFLDQSKHFFLLMMGEGELRQEMEKFIAEKKLSTRVHLTGFVNQMDVSNYYTIADVFVMCSGLGETWGLAVNEAMNFSLPVIVSDLTGCSDDLVLPNRNGFITKTGNVDDLHEKLKAFGEKDPVDREKMGFQSLELVSNYSFKHIIDNLKATFQS